MLIINGRPLPPIKPYTQPLLHPRAIVRGARASGYDSAVIGNDAAVIVGHGVVIASTLAGGNAMLFARSQEAGDDAGADTAG